MAIFLWMLVWIWVLSALWITWTLRRAWPEIEQKAIEKDAGLNAMGCVPPPIKAIAMAVIYVIGPFVVGREIYGQLGCWLYGFKVRRAARKAAKEFEKLEAEATDLNFKIALAKSRREMATLVKKLSEKNNE